MLLRLPKVNIGDGRGNRLPPISQETLAEMIGTNRSRMNYFMNKFHQLGMIDYRGPARAINSRCVLRSPRFYARNKHRAARGGSAPRA